MNMRKLRLSTNPYRRQGLFWRHRGLSFCCPLLIMKLNLLILVDGPDPIFKTQRKKCLGMLKNLNRTHWTLANLLFPGEELLEKNNKSGGFIFLCLGFARTLKMVILSALGDISSVAMGTTAGTRHTQHMKERSRAVASKWMTSLPIQEAMTSGQSQLQEQTNSEASEVRFGGRSYCLKLSSSSWNKAEWVP